MAASVGLLSTVRERTALASGWARATAATRAALAAANAVYMVGSQVRTYGVACKCGDERLEDHDHPREETVKEVYHT